MVKIHCLHPVNNAIGAVIFVHGITGEYQETWKALNSDDDPYWPHWLKKDFPDLSIFAFNYPSKKTKWGGEETPPPIELASQAYDNLMRETELQGKPLLFICHSMGGLIVKLMLRKAEASADVGLHLAEQTKGVVFIAVPHAGAQKASSAIKFGIFIRPSDATKDMAWNHHYLADLKEWYELRSKPLGIKTWAYAAERDTVVDELSAHPGVDGVKLKKVPGDHSSVCKFQSPSADLYRDIHDILSQFRKDAFEAQEPTFGQGEEEEQSHAAVGAREQHGYEVKRWTEPFPECAQLYVDPQQGTSRSMINATALVRCNRQRISRDEEIERAFYLSAKSIRLTMDVTGGEIDPHFGINDQSDDRPCELSRAGDALVFDAWNGMPFLKGELYRGEWLPRINIHAFDDCEVKIRVGAYPEAISLDILDSNDLPEHEVSDLKMKLAKVVACRALERVDDQLLRSR